MHSLKTVWKQHTDCRESTFAVLAPFKLHGPGPGTTPGRSLPRGLPLCIFAWCAYPGAVFTRKERFCHEGSPSSSQIGTGRPSACLAQLNVSVSKPLKCQYIVSAFLKATATAFAASLSICMHTPVRHVPTSILQPVTVCVRGLQAPRDRCS